MRGSPFGMTVMRPESAEEAMALFADDPHALPLAGGTDLMVLWNMGLLNNRVIIDLSALHEWARVKKAKGVWRLGALVTHSQVQETAALRRELPLLAQACATVGAAAIQNRGTLGGNIANASPAGDTFPALAVYDAVVHTSSVHGGRSLPFLEVFAGVKKTHLASSELISSIEVPVPARPTRQVFRKVGTRAAQAISKVCAAGLLWLDRGHVRELRFALGSVAPTVRRASAVEALVRGQRLTPALASEACRVLADDISPIDDIRSTKAYRLLVSRNILRQLLLPS